MPSFKFSSRPPARKRPVICKKSPPDSDPPLPPKPPLQLNAFVAYADNDPVMIGKQEAVFTLDWDRRLAHYFGRSNPSYERLELTLTQTANPQLWNAMLNVWDAYRHPETFLYYDVFVPIDRPWGTPSFGDVWISGQDYRIIQAKE